MNSEGETPDNQDNIKIGITYNLKEHVYPVGELDAEQVEEFDSPQTIEEICDVFRNNGMDIIKLGGDISILEKIRKERPNFIFNMAEGFCGRNRESHIPCLLEMLNIPYSGSDPLTLGLTLDKTMTKKIAAHAEIPTPRYIVIKRLPELRNIEHNLEYPLITKPAWEGSSKGIYRSSLSHTRKALEKNIEFLLEKYPSQPLIVEEYISGRELTAAVVGNQPDSLFGIMEIADKNNAGGDFIYSLETKRNWENEVKYILSPKISSALEKRLDFLTRLAFSEFGCRDYARMDFRINSDEQIFLLEINPLPGLSPGYSDLAIMAEKKGITYDQLIISILKNAFSRYGINQGSIKPIKVA